MCRLVGSILIPYLRTLTCFVLAGICPTLDHNTGCEIRSKPYCKCEFLNNDTRGTERDQISRGVFSRAGWAGGRVVGCATFPLTDPCAQCTCLNDSGLPSNFYVQFLQHVVEDTQSQDVPGAARQGV